MYLTIDYHTHTKFSHGKGTIMENAISAKNAGLKGIAITDHGYAHHAFGIKQKKLLEMKNLCMEAEKATGVKVLLGVESNILGISGKTDMKLADYDVMDVYLAGVHKFILYDKFKEWFSLYGANLLARK
ncbi:MAG: PHP domain-containing protein, partial [Clostridia bacterium]|nr:PHP domain-containing protein [Clostridia bacterium]